MLVSFEVVVEVHVGALRNLIDETHLKELINNLKHKVLRVEILEGCANALVDVVERKTAVGGLKLTGNEVAKLITLISYLIKVLVSSLLQAIQETFLLKLGHALL